MAHKDDARPPPIEDVRELGMQLGKWLVRTPVVRCRNLEVRLGMEAEIYGKLEFLQHTGTFKPRGALSNALALDKDGLQAGITAVSAGNHAIAASFAAQAVGTTAKVVMIESASPVRMAACREFGAEIVLARDVHEAFDLVDRIRDEEGRRYVHPFEGPRTAMGTATVGLEICEQLAAFDMLVVPIGGGGLCAGISSAVKQVNPDCEIVGVEPRGADTMHRSFAAGEAVKIDKVDTIADSLGAPFALPYSFSLCHQNVDRLVMISDDEMRSAMRTLFADMKIAVEPACAASTAAIEGPLRQDIAGKSVVLVFCGSNIDAATFAMHAGLDRC